MEDWLLSDGLALIDRMAYEKEWGSWVNDALIWAVTHVYGAYLRVKGSVVSGQKK